MEFIYTPKSGSRVVHKKDCPQVRLIQYSNGSYAAVGGVKLVFDAALQGRAYWRGAARHMAEMIVMSYGGVAWDEQGTVCLIVPRLAAKQALVSMRLARKTHGDRLPSREHSQNDLANNLACKMAGWKLVSVGSGLGGVEWENPIPFQLENFEGSDENLTEPVICRKAWDCGKFDYSIGETRWSAPWGPHWDSGVKVEEEALASSSYEAEEALPVVD